ncbi:uncharacterized protein EI97DRAFT_450493 [Westerdykella ornata]|uniref:EKC/KEOPS complex subunit BUD32 n=1 Tax=Westerdykella ornata TaxID=318751 RepID=A0A6A6JMK4_WESOR|nr:uncharacterized protein EI97DRAFT_450493 [Westerdykella ornata]KAF2276159.1 hypothetical protein EI97DRAFT_450493 [Westerdykella ornata]
MYLDSASQTAIKTAHDEDNERMIAVEKAIHERFQQRGGHDGLLKYHGPYDFGIRLDIQGRAFEQELRWVYQIRDALCYAHNSNVIHGDLTLHNVLLTDKLDAKLADFGSSSLDGSPLLVVVNVSHRYLGPRESVRADLFALRPLGVRKLEKKKSQASIKAGDFPETETLGPVGVIITRCWRTTYASAADVRKDIEGIAENLRDLLREKRTTCASNYSISAKGV